MELSALIVVLLILSFIFPFLFMNGNKKIEQQLKNELENLATHWNSEVGTTELMSNTIIALSKPGNRLFVVKQRDKNWIKTQITLSEMKQCNVRTSRRTVTQKTTITEVIDRIELAFSPKGNNRPEIIIEFYDSDFDSYSISSELQIAQKWQKIAAESIEKLSI
jgi:hypothetical protein